MDRGKGTSAKTLGLPFLNSHTEGGELGKTTGLVISAMFYGIHNYSTQTVKGNV